MDFGTNGKLQYVICLWTQNWWFSSRWLTKSWGAWWVHERYRTGQEPKYSLSEKVRQMIRKSCKPIQNNEAKEIRLANGPWRVRSSTIDASPIFFESITRTRGHPRTPWPPQASPRAPVAAILAAMWSSKAQFFSILGPPFCSHRSLYRLIFDFGSICWSIIWWFVHQFSITFFGTDFSMIVHNCWHRFSNRANHKIRRTPPGCAWRLDLLTSVCQLGSLPPSPLPCPAAGSSSLIMFQNLLEIMKMCPKMADQN